MPGMNARSTWSFVSMRRALGEVRWVDSGHRSVEAAMFAEDLDHAECQPVICSRRRCEREAVLILGIIFGKAHGIDLDCSA